ncbi:30S ribosomal protein S20 [Leptolyngbya iicbica]|uniref:Small ribosomal subunit protein bS20 n=2 Tax=Cyanophyceae TaxID=3028117 RepID=A0A4Q7EFY5_9CYAN|nr:30S ribosomal protein S20 [Leptolyngbya sp. LK]RZM82511.1 30S ribosomal protein S20 [Leptolyngbya sp. LK]
MANIKSAIKRIQVSERNRLRNKSYRSAVKTLSKRYFVALDAYIAEPNSTTLEAAQSALSEAFSQIDKAVKRGVYHRNAGARRKARLSKALKTVETQGAVAS